jgi:hypothetical protein
MRKTSVSLLPRGQWVCDKSRAFRVRKKKKKLCVFAPLRLRICKGCKDFFTFLVKIFGDYRNKSYLCTTRFELILIYIWY